MTNSETLLGNKPLGMVGGAIIDLTRRYDIRLTKLPTLFRDEQWEAIDLVTFDHEPGSTMHIVGHGPTTSEAVSDLLKKLAAVAGLQS